MSAAGTRGTSKQLEAFERFVETAHPVMCCSVGEVQRLAGSDSELGRTFYMRGSTNLEKGSHVLRGPAWDAIRPAAETAFFGDDVKRLIHFAALSPDDQGLSSYGECSVTLRTNLTNYRTSLLENNMLVFFKEKCEDYWRTERIPRGYRAAWEDRARLAVAKLGERLKPDHKDAEFAAILLTRGPSTADDEFIELHVLGSITVRTIEKIVLNRRPPKTKSSVLRALNYKLDRYNVAWLDRSSMP
ncbi:MAG: hypothetical protein EA424_07345 [Planctomycetaceae bacterium]|nr:MAG: hypothetical protein EA424_07345 [Planctomycetaceae bacterium]